MRKLREIYRNIEIYQTIEENRNGYLFNFNGEDYGAWVSVSLQPSETKALEEHWSIHLESAKKEIDKLYEKTN